MANNVKNILTFQNLKPNEKEFILERFIDHETDDFIFDFDTIIPEPRKESDCPEDCKVNSKSHIVADKERPWFDWYEWRNKYWGTKWNAYDGYTYYPGTGMDYIECHFHTAWSAPFPVYEQLARKYPNLEWEVKYAAECGGENCGHLTHEKGDHMIYRDTTISNEAIYKELWEGDE